MSVLPADVLSSLSLLLENLISPNNDTRTLAEKELNDTWITGGETQRSYLLVGLSEQSVLATHPTVSLFYFVFQFVLHSNVLTNALDKIVCRCSFQKSSYQIT